MTEKRGGFFSALPLQRYEVVAIGGKTVQKEKNSVDLAALADEIERRGLKFADVVEGQYEMPSDDEMAAILKAMRAAASK